MKQKLLIFFIVGCTYLFCIPPEKLFFYDTNHYQLYLWGCYNQFEKKESIVRQCFDALVSDKCSLYAYAGYIQHLFSNKQYEKIIKLMPKVESVLEDHLETQLLFVKALELVGRHENAEKKIIALHNTFKTHSEVTYGCALAHIRAKQFVKAMEVIDHFLESTTEKPMHFIFYYLKAQIASNENQKETAQKCIAKSLELNPSFDQGWLFSGLLHEVKGNLDDAIAGYRNFLQIVGRDTAVEQQIMMLMIKQKQQAIPKNETKAIFQEALMLYRQHQCSLALKRVDHCLQLERNYRPARLLKIELLCSLHQLDQAVTLLHDWIHKQPKEDTWYRAAHLLYQAGQAKNQIITMLEHIATKNSHNILPILYLADIHLKNANLQAAQTYLKKALSLNSNTLLKTKISYQLAILYYHEKNYEALVQALEHGISLQENFPPLFNLAAYYYATKGKDLKKAQTLLDQVLKNDPKNPHYMDTQALIWYKEGDYQKAGQLLVSLTHQAPKDFYIQKHLGKTLFKQGNKQLALETMKKALLTSCSETQKTKCIQRIEIWSKQNQA